MRVFLIGNTTVEHALLWRLSASRRIAGLYCASPGIAALGLAKLVGSGSLDPAVLRQACVAHGVDVALIRRMHPRAADISNALEDAGIAVLPPHQKTLQLETSRAFMLSFAERYHLPAVPAQVYTYLPKLQETLSSRPGMRIMRKSMPTAELDTIQTEDPETQLSFAERVLEDDSLLVEDGAGGPEITVAALSDGNSYRLFPPCARYDRVDGLAGGLVSAGALAPVPWLDSKVYSRIDREVVQPWIAAMEIAGFAHYGIMSFTVRVTSDGPALTSLRFGFSEPEAAVLMPLLNVDFGSLLEALVDRKLKHVPFGLKSSSAVGIVLSNRTGEPVSFHAPSLAVPGFVARQSVVFAGTVQATAHELTVPDGRTVSAIGIGKDALQARERALTLSRDLARSGLSFRDEVGADLFS